MRQPISATRAVLRRLFFQRCFYLFVTLLALITLAPFIEAERGGIIIRNLINAFVILSAVAAVGRSLVSFLIVLALAAPALAFRLMSLDPANATLFDLALRFDAAVYAATIALLLRYVFSREVLTADRLWGAAAAYLMIGALWSFLYAIVDRAGPESFTIRGSVATMELMDLLYFSFATLTTTGFGDIVPLARLAKTAAIVESIIGQLFLAILIAKLVGVNPRPPHATRRTRIRRRNRRPEPQRPDPVPSREPSMRVDPQGPSDVARIMLVTVIIGLLLAGSFWTLLPFLGALAWATVIVVTTWPLLLLVQRKASGRRSMAVLVMILVALAVFIAPLVVMVSSLIDAADRSPAVLRDFVEGGLGPVPAWVANIPAVGERIADRWQELSAGGPEALVDALRPYAKWAAASVLALTGGFGAVLIQVLLTLIIAAILYAQGEVAARGVLALACRIGGERGEGTVRLAAQAVRSVALGVVVTALVQSALAGLGLRICGVPHSSLLAAIAFVLSVAQLGPLLVLGPAAVWLYWTGESGWALVLVIWSIPVIALDNVLRPILIRRGVKLPMLLIIAGVIGGLIGFGVIGLFVGPVILAATYTLMSAWIAGSAPGHHDAKLSPDA